VKRITVLGIGNLLMQDDGVGVHVIRHLQERELPPEVKLIDGGTYSYDLLEFIIEADTCIVVDAMHGGGEPGTIYRAPFDELGLKPVAGAVSLHEISLVEAVYLLRLEGYDPDIVVYGVEPHTVSLGLELTDTVSRQVPRVAEMIEKDIMSLLM
jgi:hydrogenase maturation protease